MRPHYERQSIKCGEPLAQTLQDTNQQQVENDTPLWDECSWPADVVRALSLIVKITPREHHRRTRDVKPEQQQMCISKILQMALSSFASCGFSPMVSFLDREGGKFSIQYGVKMG
jgi:hypothetical protein